LGYIEQLHTFAHRDRIGPEQRAISISDLALTREEDPTSSGETAGRIGTVFFLGKITAVALALRWGHTAASSLGVA